MVICESSDLGGDVFIESEDDERMKSRAINKIFTSADTMDRRLVSIAEDLLNRDANKR